MILGAYQNSATKNSRPDQVSWLSQQLTHLPIIALNSAGNWLADFTQGFVGSAKLSGRVRELETALRVYKADRLAVAALESDLAETRELAKLPSYPTYKKISADIIGYYPDAHRILLNVGSSRAIKPGAPVLSAGGLVGQVVEVASTACYVNLLTNSDFSVGARVVQDKPKEAGIAVGQASAHLLLSVYTEGTSLNPGDEVTTSGLSSIYPEGISLGRADKVWQNKNFGIQEASIVPTVNIRTIRHVVILAR